jgi:hypothetical protein
MMAYNVSTYMLLCGFGSIHDNLFRPCFLKQRGVTDTLMKELDPAATVGVSLNFGCIGGFGLQQDGIHSPAHRLNIKTQFIEEMNGNEHSTGFYVASSKPYMVM